MINRGGGGHHRVPEMHIRKPHQGKGQEMELILHEPEREGSKEMMKLGAGKGRPVLTPWGG